jgi:ABC-type multidrug transport system ATPase subunit/ABC-type multidrug transport system permease subunit
MRFFFYYVLLVALNLAMTHLIRFLASLAPDYATASATSSGSAVIFIFFSGYLLSREEIPPYFIWAHYLSPVKYAFEALAINEYDGLTFTGQQGAVAVTVSGTVYLDQYLTISYSNPSTIKWMFVLVLLGYALLFVFGAIWALKRVRETSSGSQLQVYKRSNTRSKALRRTLIEFMEQSEMRRSSRSSTPLSGRRRRSSAASTGSASSADDLSLSISLADGITDVQPAYFSWHNLSYEVDLPKEPHEPSRRRALLNNVSGYIKPGMMLALMGSSGAGKTTLLDVLARKKTGGYVHGMMKVNGVEQDETFKRLSGYVEQQDVHSPRATIREAMMFSAALRLPLGATLADRKRIVQETASLLGLADMMNVVIGEPGSKSAVPLETAKRVSMAVELVANPAILFADEPTSGLDTLGALVAIKSLRKIANTGRSVIVTIHQPSAELFELFDSLLLMQRGGRVAYFGPLGTGSQQLLDYFSRHGSRPCGEHENPADYMLVQIGAGIGSHAAQDWAVTWMETPERQALISTVESPAFVPRGVRPFSFESDVAHDWHTQFYVLLARQLRTFWRTPSYNLTRQIFAVAVALLLGLSYFDLDNDQAGLRGRVAVIYFSSVLGVVTVINAMPPMLQERSLFYRERSGGLYRSFAYFMATGLVEAPFVILSAVLYSLIFYFMTGLRSSAFPFFLLVFFTAQVFYVSYGQAAAVLSKSAMVAQMVAPALISIFGLFSGFLIRKSEIPDYLIWLNAANPYSFYIEAAVSNELEGQTFTAEPGEVGAFTSGDAYLDALDFSPSEKWRNWALLLLFAVIMRVITYLGLVYKVHIQR